MTPPQDAQFALRDHTADIAVEATGATLEAVFGAVADGLAAASCEDIPDGDDSADRFSLAVTAERREALLFDYLDELIYQRDVRAELPIDHHVERITGPDGTGEDQHPATDGVAAANATDTAVNDTGNWMLEASARGVSLDEITAREIKAVTYSEMRLERVETEPGQDSWDAYVVFDV